VASKILIDTNILIYSINTASPDNEKSRKLHRDASNDGNEYYISERSLYELIAVLTSSAFKHTFSQKDVRAHLLFFAENEDFTILYSNEYTMNTVWRLYFNTENRKNQIYDTVLAAVAIEHDIDTIYTKKTKDFANIHELDIVDPFRE
jgi:predicted nucleic acid-binding protein